MPIVIVSVASESGELVLAALDAGAVDFVQKPTALATDRAARDRRRADREGEDRRLARAPAMSREVPPVADAAPLAAARAVDIVVIGISTGGPQALKMLIPRLPADLAVPVAIVLHMPVGYTELYARKLDELSALTVVEAQDGEDVTAGTCLPGAGRTAPDAAPQERGAGGDAARRPAPRYAAPALGGRVVPVGGGRLRRSGPWDRDDGDGVGRP